MVEHDHQSFGTPVVPGEMGQQITMESSNLSMGLGPFGKKRPDHYTPSRCALSTVADLAACLQLCLHNSKEAF